MSGLVDGVSLGAHAGAARSVSRAMTRPSSSAVVRMPARRGARPGDSADPADSAVPRILAPARAARVDSVWMPEITPKTPNMNPQKTRNSLFWATVSVRAEITVMSRLDAAAVIDAAMIPVACPAVTPVRGSPAASGPPSVALPASSVPSMPSAGTEGPL